MGESTYTVKALDESTWDAYAALVERNNGVFGGCWFMGFHPEGVGKETTAELNREACTSDDVAEAARGASIPFAHLALAVPGPEAEEQS